jgi:hypothetical protein
MSNNTAIQPSPNLSGKLIRNRLHPEWGTWGVQLESGGRWYEIRGDRGSRTLHFSEAATEWEVV